MPPRQISFPNPAYPPAADVAPQIQAQAALRGYREESQMSWRDFNKLWMDISQILNSPPYDILLDAHRSHEPKYVDKLDELTRDVMASGVFGPYGQGRWRFGRHPEEPDMDAIVDFVGRLTVHAAKGIMDQVTAWDDHCDVKADKVGAWLTNEAATIWDEYEFVNREAAQQATNEDYCDEDYGTAMPSRALTPSATRIGETVYHENE